MTKSLITREYVENKLFDFLNDMMITGEAPDIQNLRRFEDVYVSNDKGIVVDCAGGKQVRLIIQVD